MSSYSLYVLVCDKCQDECDGGRDEKPRDARAIAKAAGWKLGREKDFCKDCSAELSAKAKAVLAGNVE